MAKEPDQTRWVGIRPTDPSEDIPTTTKKILPAIADLQAVKDNIGDHFKAINQNCTVSQSLGSDLIPPGVIWVITNMVIFNEDSMCDMIIQALINGDTRSIKQFNSYEPNIYGDWNGMLTLKEDDRLIFTWLLGGATDDLTGMWNGYKIGEY